MATASESRQWQQACSGYTATATMTDTTTERWSLTTTIECDDGGGSDEGGVVGSVVLVVL